MPEIKGDNRAFTAEELVKYVDNFSTKFSDIIRQLAVAGIAIAWLFLFNTKTEEYNYLYLWPITLFVFAIGSDAYYYFKRKDVYIKKLKEATPIDADYLIPENEEQNRGKFQVARNYLTIAGYIVMIIMILMEIFIPQKMTFNARIYDGATGLPLSASFSVSSQVKNNTQETVQSDSLGRLKIILLKNSNYWFTITSKNHLAIRGEILCDSFSSQGITTIYKSYSLLPIKIDTPQVLKNVLFDFGSFNLRKESYFDLNAIDATLSANPQLLAQFNAHTDDIGSDKANKILSEKRAKSVCSYLIANGMDSLRLFSVGYGETKPLVTNDTKEHRQMNRRVEIQYLKKQ